MSEIRTIDIECIDLDIFEQVAREKGYKTRRNLNDNNILYIESDLFYRREVIFNNSVDAGKTRIIHDNMDERYIAPIMATYQERVLEANRYKGFRIKSRSETLDEIIIKLYR